MSAVLPLFPPHPRQVPDTRQSAGVLPSQHLLIPSVVHLLLLPLFLAPTLTPISISMLNILHDLNVFPFPLLLKKPGFQILKFYQIFTSQMKKPTVPTSLSRLIRYSDMNLKWYGVREV